MHSSRMRTGRSLTVCRSLLKGGYLVPVGVYLVRGVYLVLGVYLVPGGVPGSEGCVWFWGVSVYDEDSIAVWHKHVKHLSVMVKNGKEATWA